MMEDLNPKCINSVIKNGQSTLSKALGYPIKTKRVLHSFENLLADAEAVGQNIWFDLMQFVNTSEMTL